MIIVRLAQTSDAQQIWEWENDTSLWEVTDEPGPFSRADIYSFLRNQNHLTLHNQERWIIEMYQTPIGMIDLFDYNEKKQSVGIGIAIPNPEFRGKGNASLAMKMMHHHLKLKYAIQEVHCIIHLTNKTSIRFFEKLAYVPGERRVHLKKKVIEYRHRLS
jgi:diamine N-acetyltransferase